ncbi:hypothetical protein ACOSQ3_027791 [Xanthoceras sorbifolium]
MKQIAPAPDLLSSIRRDMCSPEKCREHRHRRIEMRRLKYHRQPYNAGPAAVEQPLPIPVVWNPMPEFGCFSIPGYFGTMVDTWFVKDNFCQPDLFGASPLHFFAVYDGHGGSLVSNLCKEKMHIIMGEELARVYVSNNAARGDGSNPSSSSAQENQRQSKSGWEDLLRAGVEESFQRMDQVAIGICDKCGKAGYACGCQPLHLGFVGSTAVVALLTPDHTVVANCGSSRAVLCSAGRAIPLSVDHKLGRPDEMERISAAGGKILCNNGVRVYGIHNLSRSLGDSFLKKLITSQPETTITKRVAEDEFLILANDGIWNVMSDDFACQVVISCLHREDSPVTALEDHYHWADPVNSINLDEIVLQSKTKVAAAVLCRMAIARGSRDNISAIVVDLRRNPT